MSTSKLRRNFLLIAIVFPGLFGFVYCMYNATCDWHALQRAYVHFIQVSSASHDMNALFVAESVQNIHRINIFAEVVWALLSAIIACIGVHAIFTIRLPKDRGG
jgi:hypothetical protein